MNIPALSTYSQWLIEAPESILLLLKITLLLGLGWILHSLLKNRNPRWRVVLWRSVAVGLVILPVWSFTGWNFSIPVSGLPQTVSTKFSPLESEPLQKTNREIVPESLAFENSKTNETLTSRGGMTPQPTSDRKIAITPVSGKEKQSGFFGWLLLLSILWGTGLLACLGRLVIGHRNISRLTQNTCDAPENVKNVFSQVCKELHYSREIQLKQSDQIQSPFLFGFRKTVLYLPEFLCDEEQQADLPAVFAHEISHLKSADLQWHLWMNLQSAILWFHPLCWKIKKAHLCSCELASDNASASYVGNSNDYSRTLAKIASRIFSTTPDSALAMARVSQITHRLDSLQHKIFDSSLKKQLVFGFAFLSLIFISVIAASQFVNSSDISRNSAITEKNDPQNSIKFLVLDKKSQKPLNDVEIKLRTLKINETNSNHTWKTFKFKTDRKGVATWKHLDFNQVRHVHFSTLSNTHVPIQYVYDSESKDIQLPKSFRLELEQGKTIGGTVLSPDGRPVTNAEVLLSMPITWPETSGVVQEFGKTKSDDKGQWEIHVAPEVLTEVNLKINHPIYDSAVVPLEELPASVITNNSIETTLKNPVSFTGKVVDSQGNPIKDASVTIGDTWGLPEEESKTDNNGFFAIKKSRLGNHPLTVQKNGYGPEIQNIIVSEKNSPVTIILKKSMRSVTGKIVDVDGNPVEGVRIDADTWQGFRTLSIHEKTDAEGIFTLHSLPEEPVFYRLRKRGYLRSGLIKISPNDKDTNLTIHPTFRISGNVTDAETGKPIENFQVIKGTILNDSKSLYWHKESLRSESTGTYSLESDIYGKGHAVKVMAEGYHPAVSTVFLSTDSPQKFDFALKKSGATKGTVLLPSGKPAANADVLIGKSDYLYLKNGNWSNDNSGYYHITTDQNGVFEFYPEKEKFIIAALNDTGIAYLYYFNTNDKDYVNKLSDSDIEELKKGGYYMPHQKWGPMKLELVPWGRVTGKLTVGSKPGQEQDVSLNVSKPYDNSRNLSNRRPFMFSYTARTDQFGNFEFDRVYPGEVIIHRNFNNRFGMFATVGNSANAAGTVEPGDKVEITLGGKGRPVSGNIDTSAISPDFNWAENSMGSLVNLNESNPYLKTYHFNVKKDGSFSLEDIPAGEYELSIDLNDKRDPVKHQSSRGNVIGKASLKFTIPEMKNDRSEIPLVLETIKAVKTDQ